jgi:Rrf2 family iron-sulfur cluster assembly transcriptional regulator
MTHELWSTLNRKMVDYLDSVSLQDLVDQQRIRQLDAAAQSAHTGKTVRVNRVAAGEVVRAASNNVSATTI